MSLDTLRRDCLDHVIVVNDRHLRRILGRYLDYYHNWRTHLSLSMDAPNPRAIAAIQSGEFKPTPSDYACATCPALDLVCAGPRLHS